MYNQKLFWWTGVCSFIQINSRSIFCEITFLQGEHLVFVILAHKCRVHHWPGAFRFFGIHEFSTLKHQISDLADKLETWDNNMGRGAYVMGHDSTDRKAEDKLSKVDILTS